MMGSLVLLGVLWVISPLAFIPWVIVLISQNGTLKRRVKELEERQRVQPPQAVAPMPQPQAVALMPQQQALVQPQPQAAYVTQPQYTYIPPVQKPRKKINTMNIVFLIGVIFIVVAGLIFATTTWKILPNVAKAATIALLIALFFGASAFARKKLLLRQTGLTFYSLGSLFIPLAFLGVGYFELLGSYLSVHGDGRYLLALIAFICLGIACVFGVKIYRSKLYIWLTYLAGTAAVVSLVWYLTKSPDVRALIMAAYCLVMVVLAGRPARSQKLLLSMVQRYADVSFYIVGAVLLISFLINGFLSERYYWILSLVFILITMSYMILKLEQKWMSWIHPFMTALIVIGLSNVVLLPDDMAGALGGMLLFLAFLGYRFWYCKGVPLFRNQVSDILFLLLCLGMGLVSDFPWVQAVTATLCMLMLVILTCEKRENWLSRTAGYLFPWSTLYVLNCMVLTVYPDAGEGVFIVYYLFMMLFTILLLLMSGKGSMLRRFVLPFSIMLWACGVFMVFFDFMNQREGYTAIYLWLLTLYAVTTLYERVIALINIDVESTAANLPEQAAAIRRAYRNRLNLAHVWLYVLGATASCSVYTTITRICTEWTKSMHLCVSLGIVALALAVDLIPVVRNRIRILNQETGRMLTILVHIFAVTATYVWSREYIPVLWVGVLTLLVTVFCQWSLYQRKNTAAGFVSMLLFWILAFQLLGDTGFHYSMQQTILTAVFICLLLLGRRLYPKVWRVEKDEKGYAVMVDWVSISTICVPITLFFGGEIWCFISVFLLILYTLNFLHRVSVKADRPIFSIAILLLCVAWWVQPFLAVPEVYESELNMAAFLLAVFALYRIIWRGQERIMYWVMYAAISICFLWQFIGCFSPYEMAEHPLSLRIDHMIFLTGILAVTVWALLKKKMSYSILSQVLLVLGFLCSETDTISSDLSAMILIHLSLLILVICTVLCQWGLYRLRMMWSGVIPVGILLCLFDIRLDFWRYNLGFNTNMLMLAWILVFLTMLLLSYLLHHGRKIVDFVDREETGKHALKGVLIDWYAILSIYPTATLLSQQNDSAWHFCGLVMLVVFVMCFYRRIHHRLDRSILSLAAFLVCLMWWTQPFFQVPLILLSEWRMLPLALFSLCLYKGIWRGCEKVLSWVFCATVAVCMLWQGIDVVSGKVLTDVMVLGIAALVILVVSFWSKSKRWFLLAGITLVTLIIYISRDFWLNLAWWIYLLAVGVILIMLASVNEYYKKKGEQHESKVKRLMQEWEW